MTDPTFTPCGRGPCWKQDGHDGDCYDDEDTMTDPTPDRDLIAEARAIKTSSALGAVYLIPDGEIQHGCIIYNGEIIKQDLIEAFKTVRTLADRLEAANREMHARELHHFEEERISHELSARIGAAIVAVQSGEHEADIVSVLRGEKRYEHNTLVLTDVAKERDILAARLERVKALHASIENPIHTVPEVVCSHRHCKDDAGDQMAYPCPTIQATEKEA